jgi:hypothetical protein
VVVFFMGPDTGESKLDSSTKLLQPLLRRAAAQRLPILFVRQSDEDADDFLLISNECGIPGMVVDRDDVVAVYRVASESLAHARVGSGPTLIDSKPWRLNGRGRKSRRLPGSIDKMELYIAGKGIAYKSVKDEIGKEFAAELGRVKDALQ